MDLDLIRKRLEDLNTTGSPRSNWLWKPEAGTTSVRIVPYPHNKSNPFTELVIHYKVGRSLVSPSTWGDPDPVLDFIKELRSSGNKEDYNLTKELYPKTRIFVPIVVRGKESEGVKFWSFGPSIFKKLLSIVSDPDYGDISDILEGRDIKVVYTPATKPGTYPETEVIPRGSSSPLSSDKDQSNLIRESLSQLPEVHTLYDNPTYQELEEALKNFLKNPSSDNRDSGLSNSHEEDEPHLKKSSHDTEMDKFDALFKK